MKSAISLHSRIITNRHISRISIYPFRPFYSSLQYADPSLSTLHSITRIYQWLPSHVVDHRQIEVLMGRNDSRTNSNKWNFIYTLNKSWRFISWSDRSVVWRVMIPTTLSIERFSTPRYCWSVWTRV